MVFTLREANLHSPDTIQNRIVRQLTQMEGGDRLVATEIFPLVELSDSVETYFTQDGLRGEMRRTDLASESPVGDIESLGERDVTVSTFKKKMAPEKGVDTELNTDQEILNLFNAVADALMEDALMTRSRITWQGSLDGDIDGLIGVDGATPHPDLGNDHIINPGTPYSDTENSTPVDDLIDAGYEISDDGSALSQAGGITAYLPPSVLRDLKLNDDLTTELDTVAALTEDQLQDISQLDNIRPIATEMPRTGTNGEYLTESGDVAEDPEDAATDNVLEPYDPGADVKRRHVVVMAPGQPTAFVPWFLDRLQEMGGASPTGEVSVDSTNGWMTQTWTEPDPLTSWYKAAQEVGFHLHRPDNVVVIRDV